MPNRNTLLAKKPAQHIHMQKRAEVADMPVVVDSRPATIHAQLRRTNRGKRLNRATEGVVEIESCHVALECLAAAA